MRPFKLSTALAAITLLATPAAYAQNVAFEDAPVVFVAGTGTAETGTDAVGETALFAPKRDAAVEMTAMADKLADPAMQDSVATMVEKMAAAMMRLPVGKFADAIEKARPGTVKDSIPSDATLADIAGADARNLPAALGTTTRGAMGMMSSFAEAFASILPELEAAARDMEKSMKAASAN
ncbi:MAG: hypothetical protein V3V15_03425 [Sphingorhabdus sp.]